MSGMENERENRRQQRSLKKSKNGSIRKSVSGIKQNRSEIKPRKRASQDKETNLQSSEQRSENCTLDVSEANDDDRTTSIRKNISVRKTVSKTQAQTAPEPPPTHYLPIVVQVEAALFDKFRELVTVNRNLVITKVARQMMPLFMPGDQITIVDGIAFWTSDALWAYSKGTMRRGKQFAAITVIRVWNISCLTKPQLDELVPAPEDGIHYFSVKLYCQNERPGLMLCVNKKRVLVQHVRARTPASSAFVVGDQIIGVNNEVFNPVREKPVHIKKRIRKLVEESAAKNGYAEILACRPIGARSSPAPSLEAELAEKFSGYAVGVEKGMIAEKRRMEPTNFPFDSDALEIALRELTVWKCYEGRNGFETPICDKRESLLTGPPKDNPPEAAADTTGASSQMPQASTMAPPRLAKANSCSTLDRIDSSTPTPTSNTPRKRGSIFKRDSELPASAIVFKPEPETAKITSDVPEEVEMKKCDPRSGMVAYIKHIFK